MSVKTMLEQRLAIPTGLLGILTYIISIMEMNEQVLILFIATGILMVGAYREQHSHEQALKGVVVPWATQQIVNAVEKLLDEFKKQVGTPEAESRAGESTDSASEGSAPEPGRFSSG